jgi:uncharacterized protein (TIGR02147 family)
MEPNVYEFSNHRDFLKAYLARKKSSQGLRALARKAGFKSPGYLTMLIKGERKLTPRSAELLGKALALKGRRRKLMMAFSRLDSARTEQERNAAQAEILKIKSHQPEFKISAKQYSFLATWYCPVVFALLQSGKVNPSADFIAERLGRGVSAEMVRLALADLEFLGLIRKDEKGNWQPVNSALSTPEDIRDLAIGTYHRNNLDLAKEALALPLDQREFGGLTVAVPRRLLPKVKEKIRALRMELNEMLAAETAEADVYQINFNVFPLTRGIERIDQ